MRRRFGGNYWSTTLVGVYRHSFHFLSLYYEPALTELVSPKSKTALRREHRWKLCAEYTIVHVIFS
uniref:Uncharacterized protein n=1 Tax=Picea sitchensis TaxID=3332 RepID=D5ADZ1_PICSI|nr:unknown [Picea sitchensis]